MKAQLPSSGDGSRDGAHSHRDCGPAGRLVRARQVGVLLAARPHQQILDLEGANSNAYADAMRSQADLGMGAGRAYADERPLAVDVYYRFVLLGNLRSTFTLLHTAMDHWWLAVSVHQQVQSAQSGAQSVSIFGPETMHSSIHKKVAVQLDADQVHLSSRQDNFRKNWSVHIILQRCIRQR